MEFVDAQPIDLSDSGARGRCIRLTGEDRLPHTARVGALKRAAALERGGDIGPTRRAGPACARLATRFYREITEEEEISAEVAAIETIAAPRSLLYQSGHTRRIESWQ